MTKESKSIMDTPTVIRIADTTVTAVPAYIYKLTVGNELIPVSTVLTKLYTLRSGAAVILPDGLRDELRDLDLIKPYTRATRSERWVINRAGQNRERFRAYLETAEKIAKEIERNT